MQIIGIGIRSVSADKKKRISVNYRIGRFKKHNKSVYIGIGRYEKKLIGRTLPGRLDSNRSTGEVILSAPMHNELKRGKKSIWAGQCIVCLKG